MVEGQKNHHKIKDSTILDLVEHEGAEYTAARIEKETFKQTVILKIRVQ